MSCQRIIICVNLSCFRLIMEVRRNFFLDVFRLARHHKIKIAVQCCITTFWTKNRIILQGIDSHITRTQIRIGTNQTHLTGSYHTTLKLMVTYRAGVTLVKKQVFFVCFFFGILFCRFLLFLLAVAFLIHIYFFNIFKT